MILLLNQRASHRYTASRGKASAESSGMFIGTDLPADRRPTLAGDHACPGAPGQQHAGELARLLKESQDQNVWDYFAAASLPCLMEAGPGHAAASGAAAMRRECVDLIFRLSECYKVSRGTVCASIQVLDKFLSRACGMACSHEEFDGVAALCGNAALLSVSCFLVTCKFREVLCPLLQDLESLCCGQCSVADIRQGEMVLLSAIDWDIHTVTAVELCGKIMSAAPPLVRMHMKNEVELVAEVATSLWETLRFSTASIAVSSIFLAAERLNVPPECLHFVPKWVVAGDKLGAVEVIRAFFDSVVAEDDAESLAGGEPEVVDSMCVSRSMHLPLLDVSDKACAAGGTLSPSSACSIPSSWMSGA